MKKNALYPEYFNNFNCIADKCKNTCCGGWSIEIDKKTLKKYKNTNHPIIKEKRKNLFERSSNKTIIKLDENSMCPFLDSQNLCSIHKELGPSFLSSVCKIYPRVLKMIDGELEISLSASCEAAAKVILENKDGIIFKSGEQEDYNVQLLNQDTSLGTLIRRKFWDIRIFIIRILQYRYLSIEERLAVIGLFINKLQFTKNEEDIDHLIEHYSEQMNNDLFNGLFNSLGNYNNLLKIQTNILNSIQLVIFKSDKYKQSGIILNQNTLLEELSLDLYIEKHNSNYRDFISDKQYMIENYLVNMFFNISTVFDDFDSLKNIYIKLIIRAGLIKHITTKALILNEKIESDDFIMMISEMSRMLDHNKNANELIEDILKNNNFDSLSKLLTLAV